MMHHSDVISRRKYDTPISSRFCLGDLTRSSFCRKRNINNWPYHFNQELSSQEVVDNLSFLAKWLMDPLWAEFPDLEIVNGYLCTEVYKHLDREPDTHSQGLAVDIIHRDVELYYIADCIINNNLPFDVLIIGERNEDLHPCPWLHLSILPNNSNRSLAYVKDKFGCLYDYPDVLEELPGIPAIIA